MPDRGALRIGAVLSCLDAGLPWTAAHRDALLSLLPADGLVAARLDQDQCEPFHYVVDALLRRDTAEDREWAYGLLDAALRSPAPAGRAEALWAADHACLISRAAPGRLAPALLALLGDPEHTAAVLAVLDKLGEHAAPAAPVPATLARRPATSRTGRSRRSSRSRRNRRPRCSPAIWRSGPARSQPPAASRESARRLVPVHAGTARRDPYPAVCPGPGPAGPQSARPAPPQTSAPAAQALRPALERLLDDPEQAPTAVLALVAIGHDIDRAHAAAILLDSAERDAAPATALDALLALGPKMLPNEATARLTELAERDLRVVASGLEPEIVPADERIRERAWAMLRA